MAKEPEQKVPVRITLRQGFEVKHLLSGQITIETMIPENEALDIYAWCEGYRFEEGTSFRPPSITFGFNHPIPGDESAT